MAEANGGVTALNAGEGVLSFFWDLASLDHDAREKAATALVDELLKSQAEEGESEEEEEVAEAAEGRGQEVARALRRCTPLTVYAVKRLCRGLASGRQGARQGFALGLTTLLARTDCLSAEEAVTVLTGVLATGTKGSDLRDTLLGHVFGYAAIVRCGKPLGHATAVHIAAALVTIAERKSFLRESATAVLLEALEGLDAAALAAVLSGVPALQAWLATPAAEASPEALLLAVRLWAQLPVAVVAACPLLPAGAAQPPASIFTQPSAAHGKAGAAAAAALFSPAHLHRLLPVLRSSAHSHPRLHTVWPTLMALLIPGFAPDQEQRQSESGKNGAPGHAELAALWSVVAEGDLFTHNSHERKYLGFTLFGILLPHLKPEHVPVVFTPAFLRCLSNNLSKPDTYLHAAAKKCLDRISAFSSKADPTVRLAVAVALQRHGGAAFDRITKGTGKAGAGKLMLEGLEGEGLETYVHKLQATFTDTAAVSGAEAVAGEGAGEETEPREGAGAQQLQWSVEQMCGVLKQASTPAKLKGEVLQFLAIHAFFSVGAATAKKGRDAQLKAAVRCSGISQDLRRLCASRLIVQADALSKPAPHPQGKKARQGKEQQQSGESAAPGQQQQQHDYLGEVVTYASKLAATPSVNIAAEGGEAVAMVIQAMQALRTRIAGLLQATAGAADARLRSLQHLVCLLELQTLADPASADAAAVDDLGAVVGGAFEGSMAPAGEDGEAPPPHWMDTLVDLLLSLLARPAEGLPSAPLRDAAERVFRCFAEELTATGMEDLLRVVAKSEEGKAGDDDIYASDDEDGGSESGEEGGDGGEGSDASGSESDEGADGEEAMASGSESEGEGGAGDDLSDAAMFRMDSKLAAYFSTMKDARGGAKARREGLLNFKMRVLSLLEAYAKKVPASPLLPAALQPLLGALALACKPGAHAGLAERLSGLILNRICKGKAEASGAAGVPADVLSTQLRRALYLASRSTEKRVATAAVASYVYLQRVAAGGGVDGVSAQGLESAQAALSDFFGKKKSRLSRPFFEELGRRVPSLGAALLPTVLAQAVGARNEYLRTEAVAVVGALLRSAGERLTQALSENKAAAGALLGAAVSGEGYPKQARRADALKVACQLVEAAGARAGGVEGLLGADAKVGLQAAVDAALMDASGKVEGQLRRLQGLLLQQPETKGGAGKAATKAPIAKAAGDKQQQKRKPAEQQQKQQPEAKKPKAAAPKQQQTGRKQP